MVCLATCRCHNYDLDSPLDRETGLDIFKVDTEYEQHEAEYQVGFAAHTLAANAVAGSSVYMHSRRESWGPCSFTATAPAVS